jgi:hypothetical protein
MMIGVGRQGDLSERTSTRSGQLIGALMIDDRRIFRAISQIKIRSDRFEESSDYERTFVDSGIIDELDNYNHQILYGRRGTGKTHVLRVLNQRLQLKKTMS